MLPAAVVAAKVSGRVEYLVVLKYGVCMYIYICVPKYVVYMYIYICVSSKCILSSQHTAVYVSAYCYMCPHTGVDVSTDYYIRVRILVLRLSEDEHQVYRRGLTLLVYEALRH